MPWQVCVYSNYRVTLSCFGAFHGFYDAIAAHSIYGFVINHKCQFYKIIRLRVHKTLLYMDFLPYTIIYRACPFKLLII